MLLSSHVGCTSHRLLQFVMTDAQSVSHVHQSASYSPANKNKQSARQTNPTEGISAEIPAIWMKRDGLRQGVAAHPPARGKTEVKADGQSCWAGLGWPGDVLPTQHIILDFELFLVLLSPCLVRTCPTPHTAPGGSRVGAHPAGRPLPGRAV